MGGVDWHYEHICVASTAACVGGVSIETRSLLRRPDSSVDALEAAGKKKKKKKHQKICSAWFSSYPNCSWNHLFFERSDFFSHKTKVCCLLLARLSGHEVVAGCLYSQSGGGEGGGDYSRTLILWYYLHSACWATARLKAAVSTRILRWDFAGWLLRRTTFKARQCAEEQSWSPSTRGLPLVISAILRDQIQLFGNYCSAGFDITVATRSLSVFSASQKLSLCSDQSSGCCDWIGKPTFAPGLIIYWCIYFCKNSGSIVTHELKMHSRELDMLKRWLQVCRLI